MIELLHWQILATVGPEYQEFSNVWESLDDNKRRTNSLLEKLYDRKTGADIYDSGRVKCIHGTCINHEVSIGGDQNKWVEEVNQRQQRNSYLPSFWEGWPSEEEMSQIESW